MSEPTYPQAMTERQQEIFDHLYAEVGYARDTLEAVDAGSTRQDEDLRVACARLDNWLNENYGRWVK